MTSTTNPTQPGQTSLMDQFQKTRGSFMRLLHAHIGLLKAEISDILGLVKSIAAMGLIALVVALVVGNLLYVGGFLFVGEWLFGSIGWGLAHGLFFGIGLIVALTLGIMGAKASSTIVSFLIAAVVAVLLALALGSNVLSDAAANVASNLASPLNSPGLVAAIGGAIVFGILFALMLARLAGGGGAIAGLVIGAILGLLLGWIIAGAPWTWPPAVGFAITLALMLWPLLNFVIAWPGINLEERFGQLYPRQSIEAANETRAFLEDQWQKRRPQLGKK
jgi:hypothetical protein